jgi:hypothetical protein
MMDPPWIETHDKSIFNRNPIIVSRASLGHSKENTMYSIAPEHQDCAGADPCTEQPHCYFFVLLQLAYCLEKSFLFGGHSCGKFFCRA